MRTGALLLALAAAIAPALTLRLRESVATERCEVRLGDVAEGDADGRWKEIVVGKICGEILSLSAERILRAAGRHLPPGTVVVGRCVLVVPKGATAVRSGERVEVACRREGVLITAPATAEEDGVIGQTIAVRFRGGRSFARVTGPAKAEVLLRDEGPAREE